MGVLPAMLGLLTSTEWESSLVSNTKTTLKKDGISIAIMFLNEAELSPNLT